MMTSIPYKATVLINKLREAGCGPVSAAGGEYRCRCPAHTDAAPSLYVGFSDGKILLNCKAGCDCGAICDALDHHPADLFFAAAEPWVDADTGASAATVPDGPHQPTVIACAGKPPDLDIRHTVYAALLAALELSAAHFGALLARGLSADQIEKREYRTSDAAKFRTVVDRLLDEHGRETLLEVPGFRSRNEQTTVFVSAGLIIPVRDAGGRVVALKVRADAPGPDKPKYTWVSSPPGASCGSPAHVPLGVPSTCETVRLTEGELKADVATVLSGVPTVSAPGVTNWHLAVPVLRSLGARRVLLAMDCDGKRVTRDATEKALLGLAREGFAVELEVWDGARAKGIDDLLAGGGVPEVVTGLAAAVWLRDDEAGPPVAPDSAADPDPVTFPVDVFPPALADYCRQVAAATATPPDFAGAAALVTAGAAVGNSRVLELKPNAWAEGPRFYLMCVADPAGGKTPATDLVLAPYLLLQEREIVSYRAAVATYEAAVLQYDRVAKQNRNSYAVPARLPPEPEVPAKPARLVVVDVTVEGLLPVLEQNPRGVLMAQDEGAAWVGGMNQYKGGKGNDRQFWLSAWSGKAHLVDRKAKDGVPISIPRPFVSVLGGIQPDMLTELADPRGRSDGFLHRILFCFPALTGPADWTDATVSDAVARAWVDALVRLRALEMATVDGIPVPRTVRFSAAAKARWVEWYDAHAAEMRDTELPPNCVGPWGKLKSYAARLALILHYLWHVEAASVADAAELVAATATTEGIEGVAAEAGPPAGGAAPEPPAGAALEPTPGGSPEGDIQPESVERAVQLVDYLKAHTRRVYARLHQVPGDARLDAAVDWIRRHGGECTARDLLRRGWSRTPTRRRNFSANWKNAGWAGASRATRRTAGKSPGSCSIRRDSVTASSQVP